MNKIITLVVLTLFIAAGSQADVCVKAVYQFEARYHHGSFQPGYELEYEWWIGKDWVSLFRQEYRNYEDYILEPAIRFTFNKGQGRIVIVNYSDSLYADVPINAKDFLDSSLVAALQHYRVNGTIHSTGETTTIDQKICDTFEVTEELFYSDNRFYDRQRIIKTTTAVLFDWRLIEESFQWIRRLFNPQPDYLIELKTMNGFIYASEDLRYSRGEQIKSTFKVVEILHQDAPQNIFDLPSQMTKIERLDQNLVLPLRRIIYQMGG